MAMTEGAMVSGRLTHRSKPSLQRERASAVKLQKSSAPPQNWAALPEERLESREMFDCIRMAIDELPARQRAVIALRDIDGWTASEVSDALEISDANQRVLLHRARSKVRMACELMLEGAST